ncbi:MarR family winged helix-turn-helix transcriptional regulator [Amnibacterium setariae]|uniref:MarR family transcriptional regulator n=1 Tax=Amnibacterium setariae TaxID=2306585 RepID=A0A3A1TXF8_9MICO|nr:MarR family transcriptional regulator [Amnibacterium setariae]RIX28261.1 MarR family transcriptional regulator [Amnibacterium setariae]
MASTSADLFDDLVRCETRLYNAADQRLRAAHGLAASQFEFLRYLRGHAEARVADVATNFAAGFGAISKGMDRLERAGWIAREQHPRDRRSSVLVLTAAGSSVLEQAEETFGALLAELVEPAADAADLAATARVLARLRSALEEARVGTPAG